MGTGSHAGRRLLFVGAHPDDIELGCGATLARCAQASEAFCIILSRDEKYSEHGPDLAEQTVNSLTCLGVNPDRIVFGGFPTRDFPACRQAIADELVRYRDDISPDLVFAHSAHDMHQDHAVVNEEVLRVFRRNILAYEVLRSSVGFDPTVFSAVSEMDARRKIEALQPYVALRRREYLDSTAQMDHLRLRGLMCGTDYAEGFEAFRLVVDWQTVDALFPRQGGRETH